MIRLVVSDIDGTLVGDGQGEGALNPAYYDVIRRLGARRSEERRVGKECL